MLWGGLHPIRSRLALDIFALVILGYCINNNTKNATLDLLPLPQNVLLLFVALVSTTVITAGLTKRWTVSFPLLLTLMLQSSYMWYTSILKEDTIKDVSSSWTTTVESFIQWSSNGLLILSEMLTILFPAVNIFHPKGEYNVGVIDLHL